MTELKPDVLTTQEFKKMKDISLKDVKKEIIAYIKKEEYEKGYSAGFDAALEQEAEE